MTGVEMAMTGVETMVSFSEIRKNKKKFAEI